MNIPTENTVSVADQEHPAAIASIGNQPSAMSENELFFLRHFSAALLYSVKKKLGTCKDTQILFSQELYITPAIAEYIERNCLAVPRFTQKSKVFSLHSVSQLNFLFPNRSNWHEYVLTDISGVSLTSRIATSVPGSAGQRYPIKLRIMEDSVADPLDDNPSNILHVVILKFTARVHRDILSALAQSLALFPVEEIVYTKARRK